MDHGDDGAALLVGQLLQNLHDAAGHLAVEPGGGLVHEQNGRVHDELAPDRRPLLLAAADPADILPILKGKEKEKDILNSPIKSKCVNHRADMIYFELNLNQNT